MKKIFYSILAPLAVLSIMAGSLFKIMHYPGAVIFLTTGNILLILFMILQVSGDTSVESFDVILKKRVPYPFLLIGSIISIAGITMKIMHWPMSNITIIIGFGILIASCFIWIYNNLKKSQEQ